MPDYFLGMVVVFLSTFISLRWLYAAIIFNQLNTSARKKKRKEQTFKEWLTYSRYKKEISKLLRYIYFSIILVNIAIFIIAFIFAALKKSNYIYCSFLVMIFFDYGLMFILDIAFYGRRKGGQTYINVDRWIKKGKKK